MRTKNWTNYMSYPKCNRKIVDAVDCLYFLWVEVEDSTQTLHKPKRSHVDRRTANDKCPGITSRQERGLAEPATIRKA